MILMLIDAVTVMVLHTVPVPVMTNEIKSFIIFVTCKIVDQNHPQSS